MGAAGPLLLGNQEAPGVQEDPQRSARRRLQLQVLALAGARVHQPARDPCAGPAFEKEIEKNEDTYWLIFELIWRDYFRYVAMRYGNRIFHKRGIKQESPKWRQDRRVFEAWCEGRTKCDFVNANMRELAATGFMSNRGRQNVASYLVHDLGVDWRLGASWFEHHLLDHDPASNYGNWIYVAGVGNDPRPNRKFNTGGQAERYDADGNTADTGAMRLWN